MPLGIPPTARFARGSGDFQGAKSLGRRFGGRASNVPLTPDFCEVRMKKEYLLVLVGVAGVSISGPLVKWALACGASPVTIACLRLLIATLVLLVPALKTGALREMLHSSRRDVTLAVAAAALLALHFASWMTSLSRTSTFASVALVCTQPLFVAALSGLVLKEPIKREAVPGALTAVAGAIGIGVFSMSGQGGDFIGDLLALAGAAFMAGHWLCGRAARRTSSALGYMTFVYGLTAVFLALMMPFTGGFVAPKESLSAIVLLAVLCTLGGQALFTYALGFVSADVVSFALLGEPVGAAIWAYFLFGEQVSPPLLAGGIVVLAGLAWYMLGEMRAARKTVRPSGGNA